MNNNNDEIKNKIEKSIEIACKLYKNQLITDGYIIGSVAKGTAKKESDVDLVFVNPRFEISTLSLSPHYDEGEIGKVVDLLKDIGAEFKLVEREKKTYKDKQWYQIYKGELFHISAVLMSLDINKGDSIRITKDLCEHDT